MDTIKEIFKRLRESNTSIDYAKATDDELVTLVKTKKDKRAEETLIKRYNSLIAHVGKSYFMKGGDKDDIQQEGLLGFVSAIKDYQPGKNKDFKQFAMLAVKRNIMNAVGASNAKKHSFVSDADNVDDIAGAFSDKGRNDPINHVLDKESKQRIQDYMKKNLTSHESSVLALYLKGLTYNEIASRLGINRKSVDNAINSVRSKMRVYRNKIKDSKIIAILESILDETANKSRLREAYAYIYEEEVVPDTPTSQYKSYLQKHRAGVKEVYENVLKQHLIAESEVDEKVLSKIDTLIDNHDKSKNSLSEFSAYRNYFYDSKNHPRNSDEFNIAWNHHQKHNPHHWQYWCLINDIDEPQVQALKMPLVYIIEMLCDWQSAGKHYGNSAYDWYQKQKDKMILHPDTRSIVEKYIVYLK